MERLNKYGKVRTCKKVATDVATIVITGFWPNGIKSMEFIKDSTELFPDLPILETCIIDDDFAMLVLTKESDHHTPILKDRKGSFIHNPNHADELFEKLRKYPRKGVEVKDPFGNNPNIIKKP